jgi:hypothetical protein
MVTVETAVEFSVPMLQVTVDPTSDPQPPVVVFVAAETKVAPLPTKSVKVIPVVWSPVLVIV